MSARVEHGQPSGGYGTVSAYTERGFVRGVGAHRMAFEAYNGYRPPVVMHTYNADCARKGRRPKTRPELRKLSDEQIRDIRTSVEPQRVMADRHGIHPSTVSLIRNGRINKDVI